MQPSHNPRKEAPSGLGITLVAMVVMTVIESSYTHHPFSLFSGLLSGFLIGQVIAHRRHLRWLQERVDSLEAARVASRPATEVAEPSTPAANIEPSPPTVVPVAEPAEVPATAVPAAEPAAATSAAWGTAPHPSGPSAFDRAREKFMHWMATGNWIARFGVGILFIGGSFLAKYASEMGFFPIELRLMALCAGAIVLLGIGWRLREKNRVYGLTLQGGGVAIFYLTVFAALKLYRLLPMEYALALMIVIALSSAILAVAQDALTLAIIGFSGGFLAPILTSSGGGNHVALFSYYTVLNLGIFAIAWFRAWRALNLVGFLFTFGIAGTFRLLAYKPEDMVSTDFFVILFFLMYVAVSVLFAIRQPPKLKGYVSSSLVFGTPLAAFTLQATLVRQVEFGLAYSALGFGVFYLTLAWVIYLSRHPNLKLLSEAFAALGVIFASLAVPAAFDQQTTAAMWAVEGAGLLWIGTRQNRRLARGFGALLQAAGGFGYLAGLPDLVVDRAILNSAYIGTVMLAFAGLLSGCWLYRVKAERARWEQGWDVTAALWGAAWWCYGGLAEIERFTAWDYTLGANLGFAAGTLLALHALGRALRWPMPNRIALGLLALAAAGGLVLSFNFGHPFARGGLYGWPAFLAAAYALLYREDSGSDAVTAKLLGWAHPITLWTLLLFGAAELAWQTDRYAPGVWSLLPWGLLPALALWNLSREQPLPRWPFARHLAAYRHRAGPVIAVFAALWVAGANLTSAGNPVWLPYLPVVNPLDIASAVTIAALAAYLWSFRPALAARWPGGVKVGNGIVAALAFLALNAALIRALHYLVHTPLDFYGIRHSFLVQAALSIFWGVLGFAAMVTATRLARREVWIAGAALMAVVVVKLFLIDLEGSGTLARIASFITVGALLLVTGYFSPLPPKRTGETAA